jgi:diguanylate cyclase (GGDEF)-like protein/PAS domain S-box-containing protein
MTHQMADERTVKPSRRMHLRYYIALVIFVAMLPPIILLGVTLIRTAAADRAAAETRFVDNAQLLAGMVESSITANAAMIRSIGTSVAADQFLPISQHFGGSIEYLTPDRIGPDVAGRNWTLSNLFDINPGFGARVRLSLPLGSGQGAVSLIADAEALTRNIDLSSSRNSSMLVAVVDGNGHVVARSVQQQNFIGRPVPTWQALLDVGADQGIFDAETIEGEMITFGFSKIAGTPGWAVVIGIPKAVFDTRWQEPRMLLLGGFIVTILAALLLSGWMASLIVTPITAMVRRSRAITNAELTDHDAIEASHITEIAELQLAQVQSHETLADRARALALSGQRYRAIAKVSALVTWHRDTRGKLLDVEGWEELTGQSRELSDGAGWMDRVHPEDVTAVENTWMEGRKIAQPMEFEFRVLTVSNEWVWLLCRGAPILDGSGKVVEWIGTFENIDQRKRQHLHVSHLAYHDALTGLPNRMRLEDQLNAVWADLNNQREGALLYVDLDRFKQANDTYGHAVGDELLRKVADRLQRVIRPNDLVARLGGDEFAIVLRDVGNSDLSLMVGMRIVRSISNPFEIDGNSIEIGASVGICPVTSESKDLAQVVWRADAALYQAKAEGRNRCAFYTPTGDEELNRA